MTSNTVHNGARYGTHHINIADNSLDNREFTHYHLFPTIQVKYPMFIWKFFSAVRSILGLTMLHLSVSPVLSQNQRKIHIPLHLQFSTCRWQHTETKHHTQTRQVFHAEPCLPKGQPRKKSSAWSIRVTTQLFEQCEETILLLKIHVHYFPDATCHWAIFGFLISLPTFKMSPAITSQ